MPWISTTFSNEGKYFRQHKSYKTPFGNPNLPRHDVRPQGEPHPHDGVPRHDERPAPVWPHGVEGKPAPARTSVGPDWVHGDGAQHKGPEGRVRGKEEDEHAKDLGEEYPSIQNDLVSQLVIP